MNRTMIVAGVHLDRAWTDLGVGAGATLRDWSRHVLALTVEKARESGAESLVILGELADRGTALPDTMTYAAQVLGSFSGAVVVVPGPTDWSDGNDLYALVDWAPNTTVLRSSAFEPIAADSSIWISAWTSPSVTSPRVSGTLTGVRRTLLRPGVPWEQQAALARDARLVTSAAPEKAIEGVLAVPDLVRTPGTSGGWGLLVDLSDAESSEERVDIPEQPGSHIELNMSRLRDTADFELALKQVADAPAPVIVRLTGSVAPSILLPGYGGPEIAEEVAVQLTDLRFEIEIPDSGDRSTRAEFLRAMALTPGDELERHQTTALGLQALASSMAGA